MSSEAFVKNFVREIVEYNQIVEYYRAFSPLTRDVSIDKSLKKRRNDLIAKLDTNSRIQKISDNCYYIDDDNYDMNLELKDLNEAQKIKIIPKGDLNGNTI